MGTGKPGRYLNTKGSKGSMSEYALVHSNEGTFVYDTYNGVLRLKSGGHGEDGIKLLNKYNIEYFLLFFFKINSTSYLENPIITAKNPLKTNNISIFI